MSLLNARGGINKVSNRESRGDRTFGATGQTGSEEYSFGSKFFQAQPGYSSINLDTNKTIPSTVLNDAININDVFRKRDKYEANLFNTQNNNDLITSTFDGIDSLDPNSFLTNPSGFLSNYYNTSRQPTAFETERDRLLGEQTDAVTDYYGNLNSTKQNAYKTAGLESAQDAYLNATKRRAKREVQLREDLESFKTDPAKRGMARTFANDSYDAVRAQGEFEVANLALIESALQGNVTEARNIATDMITQAYDDFQGQITQYQAQLEQIKPYLDEEQTMRAEQAGIALDQYKYDLEIAQKDKELVYEYAITALENGASEDVARAILNAGSADEAFLQTLPYFTKKEEGGVTGSGRTGYDGTDFYGMSSNDLRSSARDMFPEIASQVISDLTDEQLADFMSAWVDYQETFTTGIQKTPNFDRIAVPILSEAGQEYDYSMSEMVTVEEFYKEYLAFIGKTASSQKTSGSTADKALEALGL